MPFATELGSEENLQAQRQLVQLIKVRPILWKGKDEGIRPRAEMQRAREEISEAIGIWSVERVKHEWTRLRQKYNTIRKRMQSGEQQQTYFALFAELHEFLGESSAAGDSAATRSADGRQRNIEIFVHSNGSNGGGGNGGGNHLQADSDSDNDAVLIDDDDDDDDERDNDNTNRSEEKPRSLRSQGIVSVGGRCGDVVNNGDTAPTSHFHPTPGGGGGADFDAAAQRTGTSLGRVAAQLKRPSELQSGGDAEPSSAFKVPYSCKADVELHMRPWGSGAAASGGSGGVPGSGCDNAMDARTSSAPAAGVAACGGRHSSATAVSSTPPHSLQACRSVDSDAGTLAPSSTVCFSPAGGPDVPPAAEARHSPTLGASPTTAAAAAVPGNPSQPGDPFLKFVGDMLGKMSDEQRREVKMRICALLL